MLNLSFAINERLVLTTDWMICQSILTFVSDRYFFFSCISNLGVSITNEKNIEIRETSKKIAPEIRKPLSSNEE